jgi:hypothetical protein
LCSDSSEEDGNHPAKPMAVKKLSDNGKTPSPEQEAAARDRRLRKSVDDQRRRAQYREELRDSRAKTIRGTKG